MKTLTTSLQNALESHASTLCTCWKITRSDGVILGFTSHTTDLLIAGVNYSGKTGFTPTAIASSSDLSVDNLDLEGLLKDGGITEEDIRAGVYDYADVLVFMVDYSNPTGGTIIVRRGNIGELTLRDGIYVSEIRGLAQRLARVFMRTYTPDCDAQVFDERCRASKIGFTNSVTITEVTVPYSQFKVSISGTARAVGYFNGGLIVFTSGLANGRSMEIKEHLVNNEMILFLGSSFNLAVGDTATMERGCDKKLETCRDIFDNVDNFRGFPHIPGTDKLLQYPDVKT
jgi:uncharacterized phage protein (TIGR02218 family)